MKEKGVSAVYVGGVNDEVETKVCNGEYQLVYLSPEALLTNETWRDMLGSDVYQQNLVALVVDEAHCVKKWLVSRYYLSHGMCVYNTGGSLSARNFLGWVMRDV